MNLPQTFKLLFYPLIVLTLSWVHYFSTNSLRVDFNPIEPFSLRVVCFIMLVVSYILYYYQIYKVIFDGIRPNLSYRKLAYFYVVVSFFTLPIFSNDFFSLLTYSDSFLNGYSIYTAFDADTQSQFGIFVNPIYSQVNCKYGPVNVLLMSIPILIGSKNFVLIFWISKFIFFLFTILYVEAVLHFMENYDNRFLIAALIPVWFIQGLGQFHNDIVGVSLIAWGYLLLLKDKLLPSILLLTIAALSKFTFLVFLGVPFLYQMERNYLLNLKVLFKLGILITTVFCLLGILFYYPFVQNLSEILAPFKVMNEGIPSSTFADLTAYLMSFFNHSLQGNFAITMPMFRVIGLCFFVFLAFVYFLNYKNENSHRVFILSVFSVLILVYSHRFLPWYLMVMPLFIVLPDRSDWAKWLFWISFWSMFQDFAIMLDTTNIYGQIVMALSVVFTVLLFFYKIRARFFNY